MRRLLLPLILAASLAALTVPIAHGDATYQSIQWGLRSIRGLKAQTVATTDGKGAVICFVDTGLTQTPDLAGSVLAGIDTVDPTTPDAWNDTFGHGTASASIAVANGTNLLGVAPKASLLVAKALNSKGEGDSVSVTSAMTWCAAHGASVISMSLGGSAVNYDGEAKAEKFACAKGIVTVAAASNNGLPGYQDPEDPANIKSPCLVAVDAVDQKGQLTPWSNWAENKQEIAAPGLNIAVDTPSGAVGLESGTSAATPFVSGTIALLVGMGLTPLQALHDVLKTASHPKDYARWQDGYGNLNAYAAAQLATKQIAARGH